MRNRYDLIRIELSGFAGTFPTFSYQFDRFMTSDRKIFTTVIQVLKDERLYKRGLLYTGIKGHRLFKTGTLGSRHKTWASTETAFRKSMVRNNEAVDYNNPLLHMAVEGKRIPALVVFDSAKLEGGEFFFEKNQKLPHADRIAWWTPDKSSLDGAIVAIFFFKHKRSST